ncbi:AAA family ATPase [Peristeroidobacter soli]|uniref:AAA family ATPase n=1 Tax=Peristeroidobacter soli TaxID=2497877 RepID=UPI00158DC71D|nr:AAA family ATPase [Peristeroidobacter soli]
MYRHQAATRAVVIVFTTLVAWLWAAPSAHAQSLFANPVATQIAKKQVEAQELRFLLQTKQISAQDYEARLQSNKAQIALLQKVVSRMSKEQQADVRAQTKAAYNDGMAQLKEYQKQYVAQQRQLQAEERQRQADEKRQAQVAAQEQKQLEREEQQRQQQAAREAQAAAQRQQAEERQAQAAEQRRSQQEEQQRQAAERQAQREAQLAAQREQQAATPVQQPRTTPSPQVAASKQKQAPLAPPVFAPPPESSGFNLAYLWLLLIPVAGGACFMFVKRRKPARAELSALSEEAGFSALPEFAAVKVTATQPAPSVAAAAVPTQSGASAKDRLLAQQRAKYQAAITAATDQLTQTQLALQERAAIPEAIRQDLRRIAAMVQNTASQLMRERYASVPKALRNAVVLMPFFRRFKRAGGGMKILMLIGLVWLAMTLRAVALQTSIVIPILIYALVLVPIMFFFERRAQIKAPVSALQKSAATLKHPMLTYCYPEQAASAQGTYQSLRVNAAPERTVLEDVPFAQLPNDVSPPPGGFFLAFGDIATYRLNISGTLALVDSKQGNDLMRLYGAVWTEALTRHAGELAPLLQHFTQYGQLKWTEQQQRQEIPRLENLLAKVRRLEQIWRPVYTAEKVFEFLIRRIDLFNLRDRATPPGLLLYGYAGNGKEFLGRRIADSVFGQFVKPSAEQLASAKDIKELWSAHTGRGPTVLFIDHADHVFARPGSEHDSAGTKEAVAAWLEQWSKHEAALTNVWVVLSAQSEQNLHPRMLAQLGSSKIEIVAPDAAGRQMVLQAACLESELPGKPPQWVAEGASGASIRELREIVRETKVHSVPDIPTDEHWRAAVRTVRGSDASFRDESKTWNRLVLPPEIKQELQHAARVLREADRYKGKADIPNILLFGPPGTGKTDIARTIANESGVKFIEAKTADLKAQYMGQSAHLVRELFNRARASAPCVLFIDEIDAVAVKRGSGDAYTNDIVTEMLAQMEGAQKSDRPVIVLAATNHKEQIDPAILRRFTYEFEIPLPDEAARAELLKRFIAERPLDPALDVEEIAAFLAKRLNRKSGSDLSMLVKRAMQRAVRVSNSPDDVRLTRELLLEEAMPKGKEVTDQDLQRIWSQIVLKPEVKEDLLDKIRMFNRADKAAPKGLLLYGPPGTGKTEIARRIADSASCFFMSLKGPDLKAGYIGQSGERVKKIWEQARSRGRCVIFVDECEGVFARRGGSNSDSASEELVQAFLAEWDGVGTEDQRVWVIGATNRRDLLDDAIVSRFGADVQIDLPGAPQRIEILRLEMAKLERPMEIPTFLGQATTGLSGRNLARVASDVCTLASKSGGVITEAMWREVLNRHVKAGSEAVDESARWDSLILADETLAKLKGVCESLRHVETLRAQGVPPPKGALLYGPPGTGKTQIARTLANESGLPFIAASTADLKAGFTGQSGQKVRELFERARGKAPCILFIDEIDAVAPARGGANADQFTIEIVNQLLQEMDGVKKTDRHVYVLAATNRPEAVDDAVRSRLKETIEIPNPDARLRQRLFRVFLDKLKTDFDIDEMAAELARRTNNIGGRAMSAIVENASQEAVNRAIRAGTPDKVVLTRDDLLREVTPRGREVSEADLAKIWERIVLAPQIKSDLLDKIRLFNAADKAAPKGLLLYGPPGTGKTEIARRIADSASCQFMSLKGPDLKAGYVGQSGEKVKKIWEQARGRGRCVIFVDECEGVFARRGGSNADAASDEVVQAFLAEWDGVGTEGQQIWVVGATNRRDLLDDAIVSRFGAAVPIDLPGPAERLQILSLELEKLERPSAVPEFLGQATTGMSGRNLSRLASEVCTLASKDGGQLTDELWREVLKRHTQASSEAVDQSARWSSLVLGDDILDKLKTLCESLRHSEEFAAQGFDIPKGALLYGPPGTGKTQIARTLANESGLTFIAASTADMKAGFVGQSGQKVRELFERARGKAPCILFIDEIESVASARGGSNADSFTGEIVTQLLQEMDGVKKSERPVFVLAATNLREQIDPAVLSRFEEQIKIGHPDAEQRKHLFTLFLGKLPAEFDRASVATELAQATHDIGGRDIRNIIQKASQKAIRRAGGNPKNVKLTREDLLSSLPTPPRSGSPSRPAQSPTPSELRP